MKNVVVSIILMNLLFLISSCVRQSEPPYYPFTDRYHCFYQGGYYHYKLNYDIGDEEFWTTATYTINKAHEITLIDFDKRTTRTNPALAIHLSFMKDYLLENQRLFIGWEDSSGNLIDSSNPLRFDFDDCYNEPIVVYARTEEVYRFYKIINETLVSEELAIYTYDLDISSIKNLLEQNDFTTLELRSIFIVLLQIREKARLDNRESRLINDLLMDLDDLFEYFDDPYFTYIRKLVFRNENWTSFGLSPKNTSVSISYRLMGADNRNGEDERIVISFETSDDHDLILSTSEGRSSYMNPRCNPSISNCEVLTPQNYSRTTWYSSGAPLPRIPLNSNLNQNRDRIAIWEDIQEVWIEVFKDSNG
jgi:hypothetical protein